MRVITLLDPMGLFEEHVAEYFTYKCSGKDTLKDCSLRAEELNRCAVVIVNPPCFSKDNLFLQAIQPGFFINAC